MTKIVDYSFARPSPAEIVAAGYVGCARYLAPLPNAKVITAAERDALFSFGLSICLVWETTANRASAGTLAGRQDAEAANLLADKLGFPEHLPLYFAVDFDGTVAQVLAYFQGVNQSSARPVGAYGSYRVVEGVLHEALATYGWQTSAWSHGQVSDRANLYQRLVPTGTPVPGTDENECLQPDWGQWDPADPPEDDDMAPAKLLTFPDDPALGPNRGHVSAWPQGGKPYHVVSNDALALLRITGAVQTGPPAVISDPKQQAAILEQVK